jgi:hypothetical protein
VVLRRVANGMMWGGLALGGLAVAGYTLGVIPDLPPAILKLVLYKLVAIGALGLIGFGAMLGRLDRRLEKKSEDTGESSVPHTTAALPPERPSILESIPNERSHERQPARRSNAP